MLYPKIDTLFKRDPATFMVLPGEFTEEKYSLISEWEWTEKVDGTNIRVMFHKGIDMLAKSPTPRFKIGGRTEDAQLPVGVIDYINGILSVEKLHGVFGDKDAVIFGEGYGDKINDGSSSSGYLLPDDPIRQKFIVFDICVGGKFWLKRADVKEICEKLGLDMVPEVSPYELWCRNCMDEPLMTPYLHKVYSEHCDEEHWSTPEDVIDFVAKGFKSKLGDGSKDAEGLIGRTRVPLFDALGRRLIIKLKTCDFIGGKVKKGEKK